MTLASEFWKNHSGPVIVFSLTLLVGFLAAGQIETDDFKTAPPPQQTTVALLGDAQLKPEHAPVEKNTRGFVTSDSCRQCHAGHHESWHASHHRTMTQVPNQKSVLADFDNKIIEHSGRKFRFFHRDDDYFMELTSPARNPTDAKTQTFAIVLMTGAHHQQGFWCQTDRGRTLAKIPFIWINKEQRWVPYGSIFFLPSGGLNMHTGIWNSNCIKCHVVGGQPRYNPEESLFDTHVAEFGISCEACHGPGQAHVAHHRGLTDEIGILETGTPLLGQVDLVNPAELDHRRSSETCGQCHSVFDFYDQESENEFLSNDGFAYRPGDNLADSRHIFRFGHGQDLAIVKQKLTHDPKFWQHQFWSDGMVRVSGREFNGLLETPCYQRGQMSCLSCHDMHQSPGDDRPPEQWADDQMKPTMRGNQACLQCHQQFNSTKTLTAHTHHAANSSGSQCYNCHMPHTTLGLMKAMRSHTIDSPNVATTVATGRPNACNLCHLDKSLGWTDQHLQRWYTTKPTQLSHDEASIASSVRWILYGDAGQRGIAGWHFGWAPAREASGTLWMAPFLAELLDDTYDVVRFIGYHALKQSPEFSGFEYDFVGSEKSRKLGQTRAMKLWGSLKNRPQPSDALLINDQQQLINDAYQRLRQRRADPPIKLIE